MSAERKEEIYTPPTELADVIDSAINEGKRLLIVLRGTQGSGKTTLANDIAKYVVKDLKKTAAICSSDAWMYKLGNTEWCSDEHENCLYFSRATATPEMSNIFFFFGVIVSKLLFLD